MESKKTSFVLYSAEFLSAVHHFKKSQIADLIIALCEKNYFGEVNIKLSDLVKKRFLSLQENIDRNNAKYKEICEKRQANGSKGGSKSKAKNKQTVNNQDANAQTPPPRESDKESESDNVYEKGDRKKEPEAVDKPKYIGAPSVEEVAEYANESG